MNPLKTNPELFCNGEFAVEWPYKGAATDILGFQKHMKKEGKFVDVLILADGDMPTAEKCTLIARPIEDMTDDEKAKVQEIRDTTDFHWEFQQRKFMYYLSIGVLPRVFEDHFGDTVIDTRTLKTA